MILSSGACGQGIAIKRSAGPLPGQPENKIISEKMAGAEGFELSTCGFGDRRSNQLS